MPKIEIYTTQYCPYCIRAKALLQAKGVAFEEIAVDGNPELRRIMSERAGGRSTVPQIFVDGAYLADCDGSYALDRQGLLDEKLGLK